VKSKKKSVRRRPVNRF
jgi:hypothetical protein